jgi:hypothetical protein
MPRITDDEKLAALEKRKADIKAQQLRVNRQLRAVQSRKKSKSRSDDTHRKIIAGALALEHAAKNPGSEFGQIMFRLLDQYARPEDRWLFEFLPVRDATPDAEAAE